jgi:hypothetical protein
MNDLDSLALDLFPLLSSDKKLGYFISGGLDSALLLYCSLLLCQEKSLDPYIKIFTVPRYDNSVQHSNTIKKWLNEKFNKNLETEILGDPDLHHSQQVISGLLLAESKVDILILGDTTNPDTLSNGPSRIKSLRNNIIQPLFSWTKKDTVSLAIKLEVTDLMVISHTCTESIDLRCGSCWQCKERAWAFKENSFIDPGKM